MTARYVVRIKDDGRVIGELPAVYASREKADEAAHTFVAQQPVSCLRLSYTVEHFQA